MKTIIELEPRERDTIQRTIDILSEYSRIYSESVRGHAGTHHNRAASAINLLSAIIDEQNATA